jgi:hypothetical protein
MARGEVVPSKATGLAHWNPTVGPTGSEDHPLTTGQLELLDDVIREAERFTGLRFSAYLGDLGGNTAASAESLLEGLGPDAPYAVLLAVSPGQRVVEVVTGPEAARRVSDRAARLAVLGVVSACTDGDIGGALVTGVRILADQAGTLPERSTW